MISEAEDVILSRFGIPQIEGVNGEDLKLITNAEKINGTKEKGYHCKDGTFKFCLAKQVDDNIEPILSMEFYKALGSRMLTLLNEKPYIRLNLLFVHVDILRKKGIATYYMEKLVQYAKDEGFTRIKILPNPDAVNFKKVKKDNALNKKQLISFYKKFEDDHLKIDIIQI
ncbi:GNAT family N-acetyltransferase [Bacillus sp. ISL-18]|uniref:GNAT family N-acetyltransferase n=1 Tax=Bacillus sp. ISL-18 TaxID=2819118 RepID=UPI001BEC5EB3|nr:GNAT family N-acetyltransferase [Bacillus sp. ISL-18]MBT2656603.1 GNAT family N-acetyltransferase [Bacillus sp. ISL-18]